MTAEAQADLDHDLDLEHSLAEGFQQADELEHAIREIDAELSNLNRTVRKGTNEIVSVILERPGVHRSMVSYTETVIGFLQNPADPEDRYVGLYDLLATIERASRSDDDRRKLCSLNLSESGYPVTVDSGTQVEGCYDATALRRSLAGILRRPMTGRKLRALIQRYEELRSAKGDGAPPAGQSRSPSEHTE
ncbi:hypothetical protein [Paraliomyxa miuraensis]|uniref:hypothetical protein n=1 Tax=Paraliomyxa miuraensis TaxID=376150 RepID=UPI0022503DB1|nr:hypothetical protein [Paraliomyxa miuraensis]MCX4244068.1 hypothetical protein [Paraliomyxa miuraensis]